MRTQRLRCPIRWSSARRTVLISSRARGYQDRFSGRQPGLRQSAPHHVTRWILLAAAGAWGLVAAPCTLAAESAIVIGRCAVFDTESGTMLQERTVVPPVRAGDAGAVAAMSRRQRPSA
jgi:hypothetical protein